MKAATASTSLPGTLPRRVRLVGRAIDAYQYLTAHRPPTCRYLPSCSEYARESLERFGMARGGWLAVRRLSRCHPWGGHGTDPVPERGT